MSSKDLFNTPDSEKSPAAEPQNSIQNDLFLFDPIKAEDSLQSDHIESREETTGEKQTKQSSALAENVVIEDLLGGFTEERSGDSVVATTGPEAADRIRSTTSFFLLDLDDNNGGLKPHHSADNDDGDVSLSSVPSEVLSVNDDNLPFDEADSEPVSGFFFNDLLADDKSNKTRSSVNHVTANKTSESDDNNVSAPAPAPTPLSVPVPVFKIGSEAGGVLESVLAQEEADHHQSILDIDIPDAAQLDGTEAPDLMRQESFLTDVEEFHNIETREVEELHNTETKEVEELQNIVMKEVSPELETELRPVFDLCQPNSAGLISIEHLRAMCGEHGQDPDAVVARLDPEGRGLLSFQTFCQGVSTMMEANLPRAARSDKEDSEIGNGSLVVGSQTSQKLVGSEEAKAMPGYSPSMRQSSHSPQSGTDADSAIGADSSTSPELRHEIDFPEEGGEHFECFGENNGTDFESDTTDFKQSPTPDRNLVRRNSWLRTSLRRSSPNTDTLVPPKRWGSFRGPRQRSTAALASALYNTGPTSSSFNSSGRSSNCDEADIHSDISIEEDVIELNNKVQQLQDQVGLLSENQAATDERYSIVKADNVKLTAKIHVLEENIREIEMRGEERLVDEQRRNRDMIQRLEREKQLEIENYSIRLQGLEKDGRLLSEEVNSLRAQLERTREEKAEVEDQLSDTQVMLAQEQEEHRQLQHSRAREVELWSDERETSLSLVKEMTREVEHLKSQKEELSRHNSNRQHSETVEVFEDLPARIAEMESEIRVLRDQNKRYKENNEELQAQLVSKSLEEGRTLLNHANNNSLAAEFEAMSENEMRKALQDQQDVNLHLRKYIDSVLLNIMEKYPELLEVRCK